MEQLEEELVIDLVRFRYLGMPFSHDGNRVFAEDGRSQVLPDTTRDSITAAAAALVNDGSAERVAAVLVSTFSKKDYKGRTPVDFNVKLKAVAEQLRALDLADDVAAFPEFLDTLAYAFSARQEEQAD